MIDLNATTDAMEWAKEFDRIFPDVWPDLNIMLAWFANAIETGRSAGLKEIDEGRLARALVANGDDLYAHLEGMYPHKDWNELAAAIAKAYREDTDA